MSAISLLPTEWLLTSFPLPLEVHKPSVDTATAPTARSEFAGAEADGVKTAYATKKTASHRRDRSGLFHDAIETAGVDVKTLSKLAQEASGSRCYLRETTFRCASTTATARLPAKEPAKRVNSCRNALSLHGKHELHQCSAQCNLLWST